MDIRQIIAKNNIFLAPMSGCTDLAFRLIMREHNAPFCFYEMVDANAICYGHPRTLERLKTHKKDTPIAAQLIGEKPGILLKAAKRLLDIVDISFLDINSACPVKKVMKKGAGAYFLKDPDKLYKILDLLVPNLPCPVTVKLRVGYDKVDIDGVQEIAKNCAKLGAQALFVHGRTKVQGYSGAINYRAIKAVKDAVSIPVFGSGNIINPVSAKRMLEETGVDGLLVARGALGNPWIFDEISTYLKTGKIVKKPPFSSRKKALKKHLLYTKKYKDLDKNTMVGFMRKIAIWYLKGVPKARRTREKIGKSKNYRELIKVINSA